jgi:hypothetical protein
MMANHCIPMKVEQGREMGLMLGQDSRYERTSWLSGKPFCSLEKRMVMTSAFGFAKLV